MRVIKIIPGIGVSRTHSLLCSTFPIWSSSLVVKTPDSQSSSPGYKTTDVQVQGRLSLLGPLLFNIDLFDLFYEYEESNIGSYADGITPCSCLSNTQTVISKLKFISNKFFHWFQYSHLKASPGKCNLVLSSKTLADYVFLMFYN